MLPICRVPMHYNSHSMHIRSRRPHFSSALVHNRSVRMLFNVLAYHMHWIQVCINLASMPVQYFPLRIGMCRQCITLLLIHIHSNCIRDRLLFMLILPINMRDPLHRLCNQIRCMRSRLLLLRIGIHSLHSRLRSTGIRLQPRCSGLRWWCMRTKCMHTALFSQHRTSLPMHTRPRRGCTGRHHTYTTFYT